MLETAMSGLYVCARYLHVVATAALVGGTLFYLWVVPTAIAELQEPSSRVVFARARWVFRNVVFVSVLLLILSGALMTGRSLWVYRGDQLAILRQVAKLGAHPRSPETLNHPGIFEMPALWFALHAVLGLISLVIAVALVRGARPPQSPLPWMRVNLMILLVVILLATLTRNARMRLFESVRPSADVLPSEN